LSYFSFLTIKKPAFRLVVSFLVKNLFYLSFLSIQNQPFLIQLMMPNLIRKLGHFLNFTTTALFVN